jgi:hypothetical protein
VVCFTTRPFYPWGKSHFYPLDRRLVGPQSRSGNCGEEKNLTFAGNRAPAVQPLAQISKRIDSVCKTPYSINQSLEYFILFSFSRVVQANAGHYCFLPNV